MSDPVVTSQDKPLDDFEAAFAQISTADNAGKIVDPVDIKTAPVVEKTAEQIEAERVATEAAAAAKAEADAAAAVAAKTPEQIAAEAEAAKVAAAEAAKAGDQELVSRLATLIKGADPQAAAREAAAVAAAAKVEADAATAAASEATRVQQQLGQISAEQLAKVQQFEKDFPDVAEASAIVRRAEYQQIVKHVFNEVEKVNAARDAQLAPFITLVQNLAERTHVGDLKTAVPDYDKLDVKALAAWVGKQPAYLRPAYDSVMKTGTAEDVKDLVNRFYAETGVKQAVIDPKVAAAAAAAEAVRQKAIKALAPVADKRVGAVAAEEPKDFDSAFGVFAKELAAQEGNDRFTR